jgi:RsiW-degrading membrane proteinase PrsW (M82 family)
MRLLLIVETGTLAGRRFVLERDQLELGRDESCAVRFGARDQQVSRHHASLARTPDGFRLLDHSANGTLVNDELVTDVLLRPGDVVQLGGDGPRLRLEGIEPGPAAGDVPAAVGGASPSRVDRVEASLYYDPATDKGRQSSLSVLLVLGMALAGASLGLLTALLTFYQLGVGAALVGVVAAFLPAPVYLAVWLWLDRYDPEPGWILAGAFVWGAGAATFVAGIINSFVHAAAMAVTGSPGAAAFLQGSVSAPFAEELLKGLAVLAIFLLIRREFDGVVDGIVYSGVVALGFATVENVLYYGRAMASRGPGLLLVVFILRGVLGPFSHALFTSMTGIGCGIARQTHRPTLRVIMPIVGYLGAVTLHGLWNTLAAVSGNLGGLLVIYLIVWAPLFLCFFAVVIWLGHRESRLMQRMLQLEIARGLLRSEHVAIVGSFPRRIAWLAGDWHKLGPRRQFLRATTRLALCYWHAGRAAAAGGQTLSATAVPVFQREIQRLLPQI